MNNCDNITMTPNKIHNANGLQHSSPKRGGSADECCLWQYFIGCPGPSLFVMKKPKTTKSNLEGNTLLNMAEALNEIRIDFELPDERFDREDKAKVLKDIRDDLTDIFWNYKLVKKNPYESLDRQN